MLDQRLCCLYFDDSGQQSQGRFFVIAGLAVLHERAAITSGLRQAEAKSGKRLRDWHDTTQERRIDYLHAACAIPALRGQVFYKVYNDCPNSNHMQLRGNGVQDAIARFAHGSQRAIYYEGLTRATRERLEHGLRRMGLRCEARNGRFDRVPEVRLADALAGMIGKVKFSTDGTYYAHLLRDWFVEL